MLQLSDDVANKLARDLQKRVPARDTIYLQGLYVQKLIESAIEKAGSMKHLGNIIGYYGPSPNWSIKQIRKGKRGIPYFRLLKLADFLKVDLKDISKTPPK